MQLDVIENEYNEYTYKKDTSNDHNTLVILSFAIRVDVKLARCVCKLKKKEKEKKRTHRLHGAWNYDMWVNYLVSATRA